MNFSQALDLLKQGQRLQRNGWGSTFIVLADDEYMKPTTKSSKLGVLEHFILYRTAMNTLLPWYPNHNDIFAEDWNLARTATQERSTQVGCTDNSTHPLT